MNRTAAHAFDLWMVKEYDRLRERLASSGYMSDDAFQDTYLAMREGLTVKDIELDFEKVFTRLYKKMVRREFSRAQRHVHPEAVFFALLRSDEEEHGTEEKEAQRADIGLKEVEDYARASFTQSDQRLFRLRFFENMTWAVLVSYTGQSSATIARRLNRMAGDIRRHFTPPLFHSRATA